jgi:hypothetical protein
MKTLCQSINVFLPPRPFVWQKAALAESSLAKAGGKHAPHVVSRRGREHTMYVHLGHAVMWRPGANQRPRIVVAGTGHSQHNDASSTDVMVGVCARLSVHVVLVPLMSLRADCIGSYSNQGEGGRPVQCRRAALGLQEQPIVDHSKALGSIN